MHEILDYEGEMDSAALEAWLKEIMHKCSEEAARKVQRREGASEVHELDGHSARDVCPNEGQPPCDAGSADCPEEVCVMLLTFSPSFNAMATAHIDAFRAAAVAVNGDAAPLIPGGITPRLVWMDAMSQPGLLSRLQIEMGHLPKVVALRPASEKWTHMQERFEDSAALVDFVTNSARAGDGTLRWEDAPNGLLDDLQ